MHTIFISMTTVDISLDEIMHSAAMHLLVLRNQIPKSEMNRANLIGWRLIDSKRGLGVWGIVHLIECEILGKLESE